MTTGLHIQVTLADQRLILQDGPQELKSYPVSTSLFGPGCEEGSFKTPLGRFRICEKIGGEAETGTIFRSRIPDDTWDPAGAIDADLVLTRILRLEGLDEDNANSFDRYIYIHGTNHEESIGRPVSQGCIRMRNQDVIDLYELTPVGTPVSIHVS